jgi:hypothetical protein
VHHMVVVQVVQAQAGLPEELQRLRLGEPGMV